MKYIFFKSQTHRGREWNSGYHRFEDGRKCGDVGQKIQKSKNLGWTSLEI